MAPHSRAEESWLHGSVVKAQITGPNDRQRDALLSLQTHGDAVSEPARRLPLATDTYRLIPTATPLSDITATWRTKTNKILQYGTTQTLLSVGGYVTHRQSCYKALATRATSGKGL